MTRTFSLLIALMLLLSACGQDAEPAASEPASPAIWAIERNGRTAWVFGTIHVLPDDVVWQTPVLTRIITQSDRLVLEIADLSDTRTLQGTFERLGRSPTVVPLAQRLSARDLATLNATLADKAYPVERLSAYESWAVALLISSLQKSALEVSPGEGAEAVLSKQFRAGEKPITGLETPASQLAAFDMLPADTQSAFLTQTVQSAPDAKQLFQELLEAWQTGDTELLARALASQIGDQPKLRSAVITDRNQNWAAQIDAMLQKGGTGRPLIAVGAGHLVGEGNLIDMLAGKGFRVTRVD